MRLVTTARAGQKSPSLLLTPDTSEKVAFGRKNSVFPRACRTTREAYAWVGGGHGSLEGAGSLAPTKAGRSTKRVCDQARRTLASDAGGARPRALPIARCTGRHRSKYSPKGRWQQSDTGYRNRLICIRSNNSIGNQPARPDGSICYLRPLSWPLSRVRGSRCATRATGGK
jgi:hypothetical protein